MTHITLTIEQAQQIEEALANNYLGVPPAQKPMMKKALATIRAARAQEQAEPKCNPHPDAPHGFDRNASHSANRYVCECEGWEPEQAEQEPVAWHHPKCDGQCIACLIEKAVEDAYGTQGRDYMLRHINAAPVHTKDLTDDEIEAIMVEQGDLRTTAFASAVIAADREKNK